MQKKKKKKKIANVHHNWNEAWLIVIMASRFAKRLKT